MQQTPNTQGTLKDRYAVQKVIYQVEASSIHQVNRDSSARDDA
jgi:hypothetical protein